MTIVKKFIGRVVRTLAPDTMLTLEYAGTLREQDGRLPEVVPAIDDLRARLATVERQLAEYDGILDAVDELRRDSLRIAELTDLMVTTLGALPNGPDGPSTKA